MGKKFIDKFCKALNIEVPKNETTSNLILNVIAMWAIIALGYFTMWLVYGG